MRAVPFRTSPATPQTVAFSSGSCLPASSPPHFENGAVELQHQVHDAVEDSMPAGPMNTLPKKGDSTWKCAYSFSYRADLGLERMIATGFPD